MKHGKFFVLILISFLLNMLVFFPVSASETVSGQLPADTDPAAELPLITGISDINGKYDLHNLPSFRILQNTTGMDDSIFSYIRELYKISATIISPDGAEETIQLNVDWDVTNSERNPIDQTVAGSYPVTGTIQFPDGYEVADDVLKQLTFNAEVYIPEEKIKIVRMKSSDSTNTSYALQLGESPNLKYLEKNGSVMTVKGTHILPR